MFDGDALFIKATHNLKGIFKFDSISTNDHVRPSGSLYPNIGKVVCVTLIQIASFEFMQTNHTLFQSGEFLFQIVDSSQVFKECYTSSGDLAPMSVFSLTLTEWKRASLW